jgi:hypothetical protein
MNTDAKRREVLPYQPRSATAGGGWKLAFVVIERSIFQHYVLSILTLCVTLSATLILVFYQPVMNWQFAPAGSRKIWVSSYATMHIYRAGIVRPMTAGEIAKFNQESKVPVGLRETNVTSLPLVFRSSTVEFWRHDQVQSYSQLKIDLYFLWIVAVLIVCFWVQAVRMELTSLRFKQPAL